MHVYINDLLAKASIKYTRYLSQSQQLTEVSWFVPNGKYLLVGEKKPEMLAEYIHI